eukprot:scaffold410483_cov21-Prasinocladus_malaysianus.AAC.1
MAPHYTSRVAYRRSDNIMHFSQAYSGRRRCNSPYYLAFYYEDFFVVAEYLQALGNSLLSARAAAGDTTGAHEALAQALGELVAGVSNANDRLERRR